MSSPPISTGFLQPQTLFGDYNNTFFAIQQALAKMQTATLVQIISCTNDGGLSPVGFVDVLPLVNQINGAGAGTPRVTIYGLPYLRIQGGSNAIILDPQPGDIGIAVFASRDISTVVATKAQANPATFRMYDFSDGLYLGGVLNGQPSQYVQFSSAGIAIVSPGTITLQGNIVLNGPVAQSGGDVSMSGSLTTGGDVVANGISVDNHVHGGTQPGSGETGPPYESIPIQTDTSHSLPDAGYLHAAHIRMRNEKQSLSEKRKRFVAEYLIGLNGTQAAMRAGYSEKTANEQAARLLANVSIRQEIEKRMEKRAAEMELKAQEVIDGICRTIKRCEGPGNAFNPQAVLRGYELLGRHLAMFTDRTEASGPRGSAIPISLKADEMSLADLAAEIRRERSKKDGDAR